MAIVPSVNSEDLEQSAYLYRSVHLFILMYCVCPKYQNSLSLTILSQNFVNFVASDLALNCLQRPLCPNT